MKKWFALLMSCLAVGLVTGGCGSDDDDGDDGGADNAATTEQPAEKAPAEPGGAAKSTVTVSMKNTLYVPMDVKVRKGGTIEWTNDDPFPHTVTKGSGPGPKFDSGSVDGGGTFEQKFDTAGKIDYVCTIHPNQTGTITVE
jgi:plastocyanin